MDRLAKRLERIAKIVIAEEDGNMVPYGEFCDYVKSQKGKLKHYVKNMKVRAWQSDGSESVHNELENTDYNDIKPGSWVVINVSSNGENQVKEDGKFRERYSLESFKALPNGEAKNDTDGYYLPNPKKASYYGMPYDGHWGDRVTVDMGPSWGGGATADLTMNHYIGTTNVETFKDCYPIEKNALSKTYVVVASRRAERIARMITALNDVDFNRFKAIFDGMLRETSVDVSSVQKANARDFGIAAAKVYAEEARSSGESLTTDEYMKFVREASAFFAEKVRPILSKIDDFMRERTWNIAKASDIYMMIDAFSNGWYDFVNMPSRLMLNISDYMGAFKQSAEKYMYASSSNIRESGFENKLWEFQFYLEEGIAEKLKKDYERFQDDVKTQIEHLKNAQSAEQKGDITGMWKEMADFDDKFSSMRSFSNFTSRDNLYKVFFNLFIGERMSASAFYDINKWTRMQQLFRKRFFIIPSCIEKMQNAISRFLSRHSKENDATDIDVLYREDAIKCYNSIASDYVNIVQALGGSGVIFNLDYFMSGLKTAIDKM